MQGVLGPAKPSARQSWLGVLVICYLLSSTTKVHLLVLDRRRCTNIDRRTSSLILNQFHFRAIVLKKPVTTVHVSRLLLAAMELLPLKSVQGKLGRTLASFSPIRSQAIHGHSPAIHNSSIEFRKKGRPCQRSSRSQPAHTPGPPLPFRN